MPRPQPWFLALLLPLLLATLLGTTAPAQAQQTGPVEPGPPLREILFQAALEALPAPPAFIRLVRVTLEPGASVPLHTHPGPEFGRVESGSLTVRVDGEAVIAQASQGGTPQPARVPPIGEEFELRPGDQIVYPADVPFTFSNQSRAVTTLLTVLIVPAGNGRPAASAWAEGTPGPDALGGVTSQILGDAVAIEWPASPVVVVLDRLALGPGQAIPGRGGPVLLAVESGQFGFALLQGQFQVSGGGSAVQPNATPGSEYRLNPGNAVFFPGGINEVPRPNDGGLLVLIRLSVLSAAGGSTTIMPSAGDTAADAPLANFPPAGADPFAVGARALVTEAGVRLRGSPSTTAPVVAELQAGREVVIAGPPEEGDGIVWYPVQAADDSEVIGYIAQEFLTPRGT